MRIFFLLAFFAFIIPAKAQLNLDLLANFTYPSKTLAGCWHYTGSDSTPYALIGTSLGISFLDMTDPSQPNEVFFEPSPPNNWREIKTYGDFAYVCTEALNSGIQIMDLSGLPDTVVTKVWFGDDNHPNMVKTCHALTVDDGQHLYLFGGSTITNGAVICDLADPWNPEIVGNYTDFYIHDGYVRNDTLWSAEIYDGQFSVIDVSDKANPTRLVSVPTPGAFTHTTWLSDDGQYCFTADERQNTPMASFRVNDMQDIEQLDGYFPSQRPSSEVHNCRVKDRFVVNACYGGQLTIVDAKRPDNMVETAWAILGNSLVWDVDPFLSDSFLIATAKVEGVFVFKPTWTPAAWLEGNVTDEITGLSLPGVEISIDSLNIIEQSDAIGAYKTGSHLAGSYTLIASKAGYVSDTIMHVLLENDVVTKLDIQLMSLPTSTQGFEQAEMRVFPTLFTNRLHLIFAETCQDCVVQIIDLQGKVLKNQQFSSQNLQLDVTNIGSGSYFLRLVQQNGHVLTQKIEKSR